MMRDLIKKRGEAASKSWYDARSHKKDERSGIIAAKWNDVKNLNILLQ
jgi:hypothetical protein